MGQIGLLGFMGQIGMWFVASCGLCLVGCDLLVVACDGCCGWPLLRWVYGGDNYFIYFNLSCGGLVVVMVLGGGLVVVAAVGGGWL